MSLTLIPGTLDLMVLAAVSVRNMHGYAIGEWITSNSGHDVAVEEGALYTCLQRLQQRGYLKSEWTTSAVGRRRRTYALTPEGEKRFRALQLDWARYVNVMTHVVAAAKQERRIGSARPNP